MAVNINTLSTLVRVLAHLAASTDEELDLLYDHLSFPDTWLTTTDTASTHVISIETLDATGSPDVAMSTSVTTLNGVIDQVLQLGHNAAGNGRLDASKHGWWLQLEYKFKTGPGGGDPTEAEFFPQFTSADGLTVRRPISCNVDINTGDCTFGLRGDGSWETSAGTQRWRFDEATGLVDINQSTGGIRRLGNNTDIIWGQRTNAAIIGLIRVGADDRIYLDADQGSAGVSVNASTKINPGGTTKLEANTTGVGFFNTAPIAKPSVTGAKGGNAALTSLITALANYGLITDNTT